MNSATQNLVTFSNVWTMGATNDNRREVVTVKGRTYEVVQSMVSIINTMGVAFKESLIVYNVKSKNYHLAMRDASGKMSDYLSKGQKN